MKLRYKLLSGVIVAGILYVLYTKHKHYTTNKRKQNTPSVYDSSTQTDIHNNIEVQDSDTQTTFLNTVTEETDSQLNLAELSLQSPDTTNSDYSTNSPITEDLIQEVQQLDPIDYSDIEEMSMVELKEYCKLHGIKGISRMKKIEIIDIIKKMK